MHGWASETEHFEFLCKIMVFFPPWKNLLKAKGKEISKITVKKKNCKVLNKARTSISTLVIINLSNEGNLLKGSLGSRRYCLESKATCWDTGILYGHRF